jgi:hypothetical protein
MIGTVSVRTGINRCGDDFDDDDVVVDAVVVVVWRLSLARKRPMVKA